MGKRAPKQINGWVLRDVLGSGGNSIVYSATRDGREKGALKILKTRLNGGKKKTRFVNEIQSLKQCQSIKGVIPLLDDGEHEGLPFLVCAVAKPVKVALESSTDIKTVIDACESYAKTLSIIHDKNISHRDIKPENLFWLKGEWMIGDFGLAQHPQVKDVTSEGEKMGPLFYIAPEMLNHGISSSGKPADVYSLAKTLWVLATGKKFPIPGQHLTNDKLHSLNNYLEHPYLALLDRLLEWCTDPNPDYRPTMQEFCNELNCWKLICDENNFDMHDRDWLYQDVYTVSTNHYRINHESRMILFQHLVCDWLDEIGVAAESISLPSNIKIKQKHHDANFSLSEQWENTELIKKLGLEDRFDFSLGRACNLGSFGAYYVIWFNGDKQRSALPNIASYFGAFITWRKPNSNEHNLNPCFSAESIYGFFGTYDYSSNKASAYRIIDQKKETICLGMPSEIVSKYRIKKYLFSNQRYILDVATKFIAN